MKRCVAARSSHDVRVGPGHEEAVEAGDVPGPGGGPHHVPQGPGAEVKVCAALSQDPDHSQVT